MSILLDALKKSEEQRQLGTAPNIYSNVEGDDEAGGTANRWVPIVMMATTALIIVWIGWNQYQPPFNVLDAEGKPPDTTVFDEQALREETAAAEPELEAEAAPAGIAEDTQETNQPGGLRRPGFNSPIRDFKSGNTAAAVKPPLVSGGANAEAEQRERLKQSFSRYEAASPPPAEGGDSEPGTSSQGIEPFVPAEPEPLSYWALPQGVRDNLPEFKISVMVYAEQPEDRFLLMNGKRWVEKESEGGVRLDEIRRDGAVFLYQKYRFLVKG